MFLNLSKNQILRNSIVLYELFSNSFIRLWSLYTAKTILHTFYIFTIYNCMISLCFFFRLYWGSNFATRGNRTRCKTLVFSPEFCANTFTNQKKIYLRRIFNFELACLITPLHYFKLMKIAQKMWLNRIFCRVFFNFLRYLLVQGVPKYLGLFEHVATFQFTLCYNLYYWSFFNRKQNFNLLNVRQLPRLKQLSFY